MTNHVDATRLVLLHGYPAHALCKIGDSAVGNCYIKLSTSTLTITTYCGEELATCGEELATWPYSTIRDFNCHDDIFTFTSGRKGPFGVEKYDFQFIPSTFEVFKAALSTTTGAKFGHSAPRQKATLSSSSMPDTVSNEQYVSHPPKCITPASNTSNDVSNGVTAPSDIVLCRLSSTSSSCSSSSSSSSSSSFTEDYAMPMLRKQLSVPSLKRVVHQYEEIDMPADGNSMSNSPSTSPFTHAASNSPAGDGLLAGNGYRRTSNSSSFEDTALPSAPGHTKSVPLSIANPSSSVVQTRSPGEHKLSTVYENVNPYQRYDFVPLRQQSLHAEPLPGSRDPGGRTQLSFASSNGEEVLYDVPRSLNGDTLPRQALAGPSGARPGMYENVQCGPYENVSGSWEGSNANQSRGSRLLSPPPSTTTIPLHHQYVNLVGLTQQFVQDIPVAGDDGIERVGRVLPSPLSVAARPTHLQSSRTADQCAALMEGDYIPMSPSEEGVWPMTQDYSMLPTTQDYSMQQHEIDGRPDSSVVIEPGEEEDGYVTMRRQIPAAAL